MPEAQPLLIIIAISEMIEGGRFSPSVDEGTGLLMFEDQRGRLGRVDLFTATYAAKTGRRPAEVSALTALEILSSPEEVSLVLSASKAEAGHNPELRADLLEMCGVSVPE